MEETTQLKNEITRLNKIINILVDQIGMLKNGLETTVARPDNGQRKKDTTVAQSDNGQNEKNTSVATHDNGQKKKDIAVAPLDNIRNETKTTVAQNVNTHLELNQANKQKLACNLETFFKNNIKRRSLEGLAAELLLLHNNSHANYTELRKESGLSVPGFSKHGPMLQSKGLIKRESFQKYVLTPHSKDIIVKTFQA